MTSCGLRLIKSIEELEEHVRRKPIGDSIKDEIHPWKEVEVVQGAAFVHTVIEYNRSDFSISVSDNIMHAGTIYPKHNHNGWESFVIYQGSMHLFIENGEPNPVVLNEIGKPYYFNAKYVHWAETGELTRFTATTIPFEPDWS